MRTTLTIEDEISRQIDELRRREGLSLKGAINDLLRAGLESRKRAPRPKKFQTRTRCLRMRPGFDAAKLNQLADELEAREFIEKERDRR